MPHLTAADAATYHLHGVTFRSFASSDSGATRLAAWRADFDPDTPGQPHTMSEEETLYVLSGSLAVEIDDDRFEARAGDAVLVPAGARFRVSNASDGPAQLWATTTLGMTASMDAGDGTSDDRITPPWAQ